MLTNYEKNKLLAIDTLIFICRSSVSFNNLVIKSRVSNIQNEVYFIKPIFEQKFLIKMTNIDFEVKKLKYNNIWTKNKN